MTTFRMGAEPTVVACAPTQQRLAIHAEALAAQLEELQDRVSLVRSAWELRLEPGNLVTAKAGRYRKGSKYRGGLLGWCLNNRPRSSYFLGSVNGGSCGSFTAAQ